MKKLKLTEKQRQEARMWLERERSRLISTAKDVLYTGKIAPNRDDPRAVARFLAMELFDFVPREAKSVGRLIENRWNENVFSARC